MPISHPILFPLQTAEYHSEKSQIGRISKHDLIIKNLLIGFSCPMIELYSIHSTKKPVGNLSISSHCPKQWQYSPLIIRKKIPLDLSLKRSVFFSALGVIRTHGPLLRKQMLYPLSYEGKSRYSNIFTKVGQPKHTFARDSLILMAIPSHSPDNILAVSRWRLSSFSCILLFCI